MIEENPFKKCCAKEIRRIWAEKKLGPMDIILYSNKCPECGHYIGLTQTSMVEANEFLKSFGLNTIEKSYERMSLEELEAELSKAVAEENFEEAAAIYGIIKSKIININNLKN